MGSGLLAWNLLQEARGRTLSRDRSADPALVGGRRPPHPSVPSLWDCRGGSPRSARRVRRCSIGWKHLDRPQSRSGDAAVHPVNRGWQWSRSAADPVLVVRCPRRSGRASESTGRSARRRHLPPSLPDAHAGLGWGQGRWRRRPSQTLGMSRRTNTPRLPQHPTRRAPSSRWGSARPGWTGVGPRRVPASRHRSEGSGPGGPRRSRG